MFTLLAEQQKKHLYKQYRLRLISLIGFFLSALLLIAGILMLPSLYLLSIEKGTLKSEKEMYERSVDSENSKDLIANIGGIKAMVELAAPSDTKLFATLQSVLAKRPSGVGVSTIGYTRGEGAPSSLTIQGIAQGRAGLIAFYKVLQKEPMFTSSALPVESLVKETNVPYTINLQGKF